MRSGPPRCARGHWPRPLAASSLRGTGGAVPHVLDPFRITPLCDSRVRQNLRLSAPSLHSLSLRNEHNIANSANSANGANQCEPVRTSANNANSANGVNGVNNANGVNYAKRAKSSAIPNLPRFCQKKFLSDIARP